MFGLKAIFPKTNKTMGLPGIYVVVPVILVWFITMGNAAEEQEKLRAQPAGMFQVQVKQGYLSLTANQAPLVAILHEIGEQAKITFDSNIGPEEKITLDLVRVPLEQGIKQVAKNATVFYTENPEDKTRRITRVVVLAEGKQSTPAPAKPEPGVKIDKPAAPTGPAKAGEKEKPRKEP
jgi:hypothetical protein